MLRLLQSLRDIRYALWFIPALMVGVALALAMLAIEADSRIDSELLSRWPRLFDTSADGARAMLQTVAGAMITVAALTFSITVLVLSLAASQYTPRIIRTFMSSRTTQTVLGVFVGVFVYCLLVLRSIRGGGETFVPSISVTVAVLLALLGVSILVYFIHHMATSIQVSSIVSSVTEDTIRIIDSTFPEHEHAPAHEDPERDCRQEVDTWFPMASTRTGYLRTVDFEGLVDHAREHDAVIRMEKAIGEFVIAGTTLVSISRKPDACMTQDLNRLFAIGHFRTVEQDIGVGIRQLADIALRAMSPALNDTTTALLCIDFLSAILVRLVPLHLAPEHCYHNGKPLVIRLGPDFDHFLNTAFDDIRRNAQGNVAIYLQLLRALTTLVDCAGNPMRKQRIAAQVRLVWEYAQRHVHAPDQISLIEQHRIRALKHAA